MGLSRVVAALSFRWLSKAWGSSRAPGGAVLLLGLPFGVLAGSMKLFLMGVEGRPRSSLLLLGLGLVLLPSLPPPESTLDMKLAMFVWLWRVQCAGDAQKWRACDATCRIGGESHKGKD